MKARPILFSAAMVNALLDGRKTQTRRVVKSEMYQSEYEPSLIHYNGRIEKSSNVKGVSIPKGSPYHATSTLEEFAATCPHGLPGDLLWVRETFKPIVSGEIKNGYGQLRYGFAYRADAETRWNTQTTIVHDLTGQPATGPMQFNPSPWKPSIFMPRRASRLTLRIVSVRVERLNDISNEDAVAEGCDESRSEAAIAAGWYEKPRKAFSSIWERINGADSWKANPWVWVIEFEVIKKNVGEIIASLEKSA